MQAYWDTSGLSQLKTLSMGTEGQQVEAAKSAAQQFESILIAEVLKAARSNPFGQDNPLNSSAMESMHSMFDQQVAHALAGRGLGLSQHIEQSILNSLKWVKNNSPELGE
ncbi:rod-binding protein [Limnobacter sp.]|uniref:rod-binding protein n=1 Tax=Limnobacter sp. TaxID=2003368 RepID=UPI0035137D14